jgi:uncharacterized protein YcbK (DUF882 family)
MYQLKHFQPSEFLPEGHDDLSVMDERLLETCDDVRDLLGTPCSINTWNFGGDREWCGFRTPDCTIGAAHSQHRLGKAADLHPVGMDANTARAKIREAVAAGQLPHLGGMELGVSWVHVDVRDRVGGKVVEFHA